MFYIIVIIAVKIVSLIKRIINCYFLRLFSEKHIPATQRQKSTKIYVRNIPEAYDEEHLQMFFEYEKGQGGGPVKTVTFNRGEKSAIIEFEKVKSVETVLKKRPVKIMGTDVDVQEYAPYLGQDELLIFAKIIGLKEKLSEDLKNIQLSDLKGAMVDDATVAEREIKQQKEMITNLQRENEDQRNQLQKLSDEIKRKDELVTKLTKDNEGLVRSMTEIKHNIPEPPKPVAAANTTLTSEVKQRLKVGDRVRLSQNCSGLYSGSVGTVTALGPGVASVQFNKKHNISVTRTIPEGYLYPVS